MSNEIDAAHAKFLVEPRLKPYLKMDMDTGEIVACLDETGLAQIRQIVAEEVRKALQEDEDNVDWQAQIVTLPTPANAISVEWSIGGKRYKGILFEQHEEA